MYAAHIATSICNINFVDIYTYIRYIYIYTWRADLINSISDTFSPGAVVPIRFLFRIPTVFPCPVLAPSSHENRSGAQQPREPERTPDVDVFLPLAALPFELFRKQSLHFFSGSALSSSSQL